MQIKTTRAVYSRPPTCNHGTAGRRRVNTKLMLTNEIYKLENEKRMAQQKMSSVERRIQEVRDELNTINDTPKDTREYIEESETHSRLRHVTMKY